MNDYNIEFLRKQFLCCAPLNNFKWPLEQNNVEIDNDVYNAYCKNVVSPDEQSLMHYRHFLLNNQSENNLLSIKESTSIISQGTTGLYIWKAAFYLAEWCIANKQEFEGKNVLELGSGVGLTGLTIINFCAPKIYYFSDENPIVLKTLQENVRLNLLHKQKTFLWKEILVNNRIQFESIDLDLVIAADILYDISTFQSLVSGLRNLICTTVNYVLIATTVRNESTILEFFNILDKYELSYVEESIFIPHMFIQCEDTPIRILKILNKNK
ncbi:PREDICTED: protein FAM86D [Ceratosolen solmsi marchali]|uniref:Protein FAM86D n=1 Tax=Ceratosolen solmsi marchali TaxID=326594 RepID=A0AAJ6YT39_9HYME|nr:PREDICTED: protein FAM86D [Ceratosolen solmsi marchali]